MMEKKKYEMHAADMDACVEVTIGDETIHVLKHIPLERKVTMATELAEMLLVPNEELGIMTRSALQEVCEVYLVMKYYTDMDLTDVDVQTVFDWVIGHNAYMSVRDVVSNDVWYVTDMALETMENIETEYEKQNGLTHAIKTSFGFLFNGEDITETLAKSQQVSDQMIEVVGKLNEANRKPDVGKVKVSGNVINIGKKK